MARSYLDTESPIVALATPPGRGALAVVRTSGKPSIRLAASCFSRPDALVAAMGNSLVLGHFLDPESGEPIDEILAAVFKAPKSFTGEDSVEFYCHGSPAVTDRVIRALLGAGFSAALPGEFTLRKFLNGKTDLIEAEAVDELSRAQCEAARADALKRLSGTLSKSISELRIGMIGLRAQVEARLDYAEEEGPEGEIEWKAELLEFSEKLKALTEGYRAGKLRQEGALVVIAGRPNAGKSSLFNLLLREERAIVSPEPGTTRDWLESWMEIGGFAVRLVDTAGLREAEGKVESEGVAKSVELLGRSDAVLYLVDGAGGLRGEDDKFIEGHPHAIKIWNKVDSPECAPAPEGWLGLSASTGAGEANLVKAIEERIALLAGSLEAGGRGAGNFESQVRIASARQKDLLDSCARSIAEAVGALEVGATLDIVSLHILEAADRLGEVSGEIVGEEVFEKIFGNFCLGK